MHLERRRHLILAAGTLAMTLALASCAVQQTPPSMGAPGFWWGFLHGLIAPFSLIGSFFDPMIRVYAVPNAGWWYDLGFVWGMAALWTSAAAGGSAAH